MHQFLRSPTTAMSKHRTVLAHAVVVAVLVLVPGSLLLLLLLRWFRYRNRLQVGRA